MYCVNASIEPIKNCIMALKQQEKTSTYNFFLPINEVCGVLLYKMYIRISIKFFFSK